MGKQSWAMGIWNGRMALKHLKVRPYFATNHILEYVLRHEIPSERVPYLHHLILPLDAELIWEIHIADWSQPITSFMKKRLEATPLIKLNHKSKWVRLAEEGESQEDSAWVHWLRSALGFNP